VPFFSQARGRLMIGALMVDVDGVLVHGRPLDGGRWSANLEADLGLRPTDLQRAFFTPHWNDIVTGRHGLVDLLKPALKSIAPHLSHHELIEYWFANDARLDEALIADIDRQREKGIKVYLATNQEHLRASYLIEHLGLGQHCDGIYYSAAVGFQKPDRQFFERVTACTSLRASELLLVDDLAENVLAARDAGWQAVQWTSDSTLTEALYGQCP
jgi:putative hydrolase of the HAD superfamily